MAGISSPGIGSNLDINGIVAKLMQAEQMPLAALARKEASYQAKLSAFGNLSGAFSSFQSALGNLNNQATFKGLSAKPTDATIFTASASTQATPGSYSINVTKLAQAQTLTTSGQASTTATIGTGTPVKVTFQFGTLGGAATKTGTNLSGAVASGGIAAGSLNISGTTIDTSASTNSAKALADAINLKTGTTGVTATAAPTTTAVLGAFSNVTTGAGDSYTMNVGGVNIANVAASSTLTVAQLDAAIADNTAGAVGAQLAAAGITVSGTAAAGTLKFTKADGSNIDITQTLVNTSATAVGGFAGLTSGVTQTTTSSVTLNSPNNFTVGGSNPSVAGLTAGGSARSFAQDANQPTGSVTIDNTNNSLQGIRDAINKANLGVTASIVSDGSATPNHLVIKSNKTGAESSMKISVQSGEPTLTALLAYDHDPASAQNLTETSAGQSAQLTVNGIAVTSSTNSVSGAIEGVSLELAKAGTSNLNVSRDTSSVTSSLNAFVKAYNDLNSNIKKLTSYDPDTKQAGVLLGDSSVRNIQAEMRKLLSSSVTGSNSTLKTLHDVGISVDKSGVMSLDQTKLSAAMTKDLSDVGALFSSIGKTSDSLVSFVSASSKAQPGEHPVYVTKLATQGKVAGNQDLRVAPITINSGNKDLLLSIDGETTTVSLPTGPTSYTAAEMAAQVQSAINGTAAFSSKGIAVSVTIDASGFMNITSNKYGSESKLTVSGSAVATLFGTATATDGIDVQGTIGGVAAKGEGQFLIGDPGSPATGLKLQVTGGAATVVGSGAARGTVNFSQGFAFHLNKLVEGILGDKGVLSGRTDGLKSSIKDIGKQNEKLNDRLIDIEKRYRAQFTALDVTISKMTTTSSYLSQQLAQLGSLSGQ
ncbi:MAG: flagellar hook-associated protein 2 [Burkholderiales bacterium]|jgi:flagellar hook-associated protein 2